MLCNVLTKDSVTHLTIQFKYELHSGASERLFSFNRKRDEPLAELAKRMQLNFEKTLLKSSNKKRLETTEKELNLRFEFFRDNEKLSDLKAIYNEDFWIEGSEMHINENIYSVHRDWPTITQLKLTNTILSGYLLYPHIDILNGDIVNSRFTWFRRKLYNTKLSEDDINWEQIYTNFTYKVTDQDIGFQFKVICTPGNGVNTGISQETFNSSVAVSGPSDCPFEIRNRFTKYRTSLKQIRIVSYNLLADIYADSEYSQDSLYPYCKPQFLAFDYRRLLLLKELIAYNGDLLLLQEVDKGFMEKGIGPILQKLGYESHFLSKENMVEGLSIFYDRAKFVCLRSESHTYANLLLTDDRFAFLRKKVEQNVQLSNRIFKLKNSFQVLLLRSTIGGTEHILVVSNTHLYSKDDADHIRLIQAFICFKHIETLVANLRDDPILVDPQISYVIGGDFNSTPEWGVIRLVLDRTVDSTLEDFRINKQEVIPDLVLSHDLNLKSACGFPNYTNFTGQFVGCLDYILHDGDNLKVISTVPMLRHEDVIKDIAMPSEKIPSDHQALICTLEWCCTK